MNKNIDINTGLDFERAKQRVNEDAGAAFREMMAATENGDDAAAGASRQKYTELSKQAKDLRSTDQAGISAILGGA